MHPSPRLVLITAAVTILLAGCGGSSGDAADGPSTTKATSNTTEAPPTSTTAATSTTRGSGEPVATTVAGKATDELCGPLGVITDFDAQTSRLVSAGNWPAIQAYYVDHTDEMVAAYDEAIALDTDLTTDLQNLRAVTAASDELAAKSDSLMAFGTALSSQPGLMAATASANRVLQYTQEHCGS